MTPHVPTVDISAFRDGNDAQRRSVAERFGRAFEENGFLALTGHGIPEPLIDEAYEVAKAFFALPLVEKMAYASPTRAINRGYLPIGIETVARTLEEQTPPDLCEALVFGSLFHDGAAGNRWPHQPPALSRAVREYFRQADGLVQTLYRIAAAALDLPEDHFAPSLADHCSTLRFVNYPDQPQEPLPGQLRYGAHHDYGGLTLVRQDAAPGGLQVCATDGTWHDVPVIPESFIVNVGDLLSRWTNNRWRSTLHRVMNPPRSLTGSTQRLSIVLFSRPDDDAEIACLPTCVDAEHPALYPPVFAGDFARAKMAQSATALTATGMEAVRPAGPTISG
jgi:isopenicillin N synthase-like dioxygenase